MERQAGGTLLRVNVEDLFIWEEHQGKDKWMDGEANKLRHGLTVGGQKARR